MTENDSPPLTLDLKRFEDEIGDSFQSIEAEAARLQFYAIYEKVTSKYDDDFVSRHKKSLNVITLTGFLSLNITQRLSVSDLEIKPNVDNQSVEVDAVTRLFVMGTVFCMAAAIFTRWVREYLSGYLQHTGKSLVERCRDRQRKFDTLESWWIGLFLKSPMITLLVGLALHTRAVWQCAWYLDLSVSYVRILLFMPEVVVYSLIVCVVQTLG